MKDSNVKNADASLISEGVPLKDAEWFHAKAPLFAKELKSNLNMSTWLAVLLSVITVGYFAVYLQYKLTKVLKAANPGEAEAALKERLGMQCALLVGLGMMSLFFDFAWLVSGYEVTDLYSYLVLFSFTAINIFWSLSAHKALVVFMSKRLGLKNTPHWGLFVVFSCFAITYTINDLENNPQLKQ